MTVKGEIKKGAGFIEEETGEAFGNESMAQKGRDLRNEGLRENGEPVKTGKPGSGH